MKDKRFPLNFIITAILLLIIFLATWRIISSSEVFGQPVTPQIRLHRGGFDAQTVETVWPAAPGSNAIIQFRGPITLADRQALQQTGVKILEYLPEFAYLVEGTAAQLDAAAALPQVYARIPFTLADKLAPSLLQAVQRGDDEIGRIRVIGWPNDKGQLAAELATLPFSPTDSLTQQQMWQITRLPAVRFIEP